MKTCKVEGASHKRPHIVPFRLYGLGKFMSRIGKFIQTGADEGLPGAGRARK